MKGVPGPQAQTPRRGLALGAVGAEAGPCSRRGSSASASRECGPTHTDSGLQPPEGTADLPAALSRPRALTPSVNPIRCLSLLKPPRWVVRPGSHTDHATAAGKGQAGAPRRAQESPPEAREVPSCWPAPAGGSVLPTRCASQAKNVPSVFPSFQVSPKVPSSHLGRHSVILWAHPGCSGAPGSPGPPPTHCPDKGSPFPPCLLDSTLWELESTALPSSPEHVWAPWRRVQPPSPTPFLVRLCLGSGVKVSPRRHPGPAPAATAP